MSAIIVYDVDDYHEMGGGTDLIIVNSSDTELDQAVLKEVRELRAEHGKKLKIRFCCKFEDRNRIEFEEVPVTEIVIKKVKES